MNANARASLAALGIALALALVLAPAPGAYARPAPYRAGGTDAGAEDIRELLRDLRRATVAYHDPAAAEADGFVQSSTCNPGKGIHFLRSVAETPEELDIARPNALVYAPTADGRLRLHGIEYVSRTPATLFGIPFQQSEAVHYYTLHVWIWERAPEDLFAADNPRITCEE